MAITITIDNDTGTAGIQTLVEDESAGLQTPLTADTGNDSNVDITDPTATNPDGNIFDGSLSGAGYSASFLSFLNAATIFGSATLRLTDAQKAFAANVEGAVSSSSFVTVTANAGETINDLFFSDSSGNALAGALVAGMTTLDGSSVYLWSMGDYAIATTSSTAGMGRVVAAFYLNEAANHLSAQVQMMTFEALSHPTAGSTAAAYDDALNFTNVLQISAAGTTSFNFNSLQSGDFLWVAVGTSNSAVLVTGGHPQVDSSNKITNTSDDIHVSQGGDGTTIGINNQLFDAPNETGVFTLVKGLTTLPSGTTGAGGSYTVDPNTHDSKLEGIDYSDYLNVAGAGIYISQSQGTPSVGKSFEVKLLNAGPAVEDLTNYIPGLASDGAVDVGTVTIKDDAGHVVGVWGTGGLASGTTIHNVSPNGAADVQVIINGNTIDVNGVLGNYTADWTAASGTFNRFDLTWEAGKFDVGRVDIVQGAGSSVGVGSDLVVQDDGPTLAPTLNAGATVSVDESAPSTAPTLDTGAIVKGIDPDNPDPVGGNALGFGTSGSAVVDPHAVFGTDGPAASNSLTYALTVLGVSSGLTLTDGSAINLQQLANGNIVGVVAAGTFAGKAAFAIAINSTTGVVTVEQYLSLHHNSADSNGDSDETVQATLNTIGVTATVKDGDGDTKTSTAVDISHQISFHDDGPTVAPTLNAAATVSVDESAPSTAPTLDTGTILKGVDPDNPDPAGGNALGFGTSGSAVVSPNAAFGADGPATSGSLTYALSLGAVSSGLTLTDGSAINLQQLANGNIVGVVSGGSFDGKAAFAIAMNSTTGVVTVEQYLSLAHGSADSNGDSNEAVQATLGTIEVTVKATDGDGDSKTSDAVDISHQISFHDDGPTVAPTLNAAATVSVDESAPSTVPTLDTGAIVKGVDPDNPDPVGGNALGFGTSGSAVVNPHAVFGADGAATSGSLTYALSVLGVSSGLTLTDGTAINLQQLANGNIVGVVSGGTFSGKAAFAIAINATTGVVTVEQYLSLSHSSADSNGDSDEAAQASLNTIGVTVTATDGDGDSKTSSAVDISHQISFHDDGPSVSTSSVGAPSLTVDESNFVPNDTKDFSGQFTPTYGADGPAAIPVTYAISTPGGDSGLKESGTGNHIYLFNEGGVVVGRAGTTALTAATGDVVFTVSVDTTGKVTLDQKIAVVHDPNTGVDQSTTLSLASLVTLTATAHDGDGDSFTSPALSMGTLLTFKDDAPTIGSQILGGTVEFATDATGTVTHSLNGVIGADGTSSTQTSLSGVAEYTISYWDTPTNVYPNLNAVLSNNGTTLTYYSDAADTNAVYQLTLNPTANSGAGSYTFTVLQPPPITTTHFGFADLHSGQNLFGIIAVDKADLSKGGLLVFPSNPVLAADGTMTNTSGSICTSQGGGGVTIGNTNQAFDHPDEGAYFLYVDNPVSTAVSGVGLTPTGANDADSISFNGVNQATDASVSLVQTSGKGTLKSPGPALHIFAYEANPGNVNTSALARAEVNNPTLAAANQGSTAPEVDIIGVKIHDATGAVIEYRTVDQTLGATQGGVLHGADSLVGIQFVLDNAGGTGTADDIYSVLVSNLGLNYTVEFITATNHDLALVQNVSGSYDLGGFNLVNNNNVPAQDFHFAATITDYDNDAYGGHLATFADFTVHVDGVNFV